MEVSGLTCNGCGSSNVTFHPGKRMLICNQCGKEEYYSRATLNANGKVLLSKENAIHFFGEGNYENARHYALEILNISQDHAPAMFIMAYCDEYVDRRNGSMRQFFDRVADIALEYREVRELKDLFLVAAYNMADFEEDILRLIALNMQSEEDAAELCEFVDKICPYFISKRTSIVFFTPAMCEIYSDLAGHCSVPKTCFALLKAVKQNPDSPYCNNDFYLKSRAKYFADHYLLPLRSILEKIKEEALRQKFMSSYDSLRSEYENDLRTQGRG
ncbi:MAG: hypothetical protein K2N94_16405 [Lachnospiraceae bacterium]|nr:hypothetical protein [Lachnospiraceae bacterium]